MEQRDQGRDRGAEPGPARSAAGPSDPLAETAALAPTAGEADEAGEPPAADRSDPPAETAALPHDIGRAAAEAVVQAEAEWPDRSGHDTAPGHRPRRWLVTAGVAVSALALAGTAAAIAGHGPHGTPGAGSQNAAAAHTTDSPTPSETSQSTASSGSTSQSQGPTSGSSSTTWSPSWASSTTPSKPSTAKSSSPKPPAGTDEEDCENTSHSTPQDEATKFSGMTKGTQHAFLAAQAAAKAAGLPFILNSGYRSAAYQERIFQCWVTALGSAKAAHKYALPPNESAHVLGYAMDIAPPSSAAWLESTKGRFGLCRRYADEIWHFEYQAAYKTQGCPALLAHP